MQPVTKLFSAILQPFLLCDIRMTTMGMYSSSRYLARILALSAGGTGL